MTAVRGYPIELAEFREAISDIRSTLRLHTWILSINSAGILAVVGMLWQVLVRLPSH